MRSQAKPTWVHSRPLIQSVSQLVPVASSWLSHGSIQAFPSWACNPRQKTQKKIVETNTTKKKKEKIRCRDPIDRATPVPIVFCGSSIIMTRWWWCNRPMPHPLFPLLRNHQAATFCLICSYADRFLLIFCVFRPTLCPAINALFSNKTTNEPRMY